MLRSGLLVFKSDVMRLIQKLLQAMPANKTGKENYYLRTPERINHISALLDQHMKEKKPFLTFNYRIQNLARDLNIPSHQLSAFINKEVGLNYNDYLNQFRVRHCEVLMQEGVVSQLNMKGLALKCGFNNRNTLTAAFKKFTGFTPSRYQKGWVSIITQRDSE
jgi:AraC-like DNA-binding protein